jgi:LacI family transcriptional regulator
MTTVYDVARLAGVSTATVSRVVRGSDLVRPATRERVLAVIEEVGFVPDASAQGLSRRRKDIIGLVAVERGHGPTDIERTSVLFVDQVVHAVEAVLRGSDCSLLLSFGRPGEAFQRRIRALSGKVDGLLVVEEALPAGQVEALARRLPVVTIAGGAGGPGADAVRVDNARGMRALAAHLIDGHGYRRLAFAAGPADAPDAVERLAAFCAAVRDRAGGQVRADVDAGPGPAGAGAGAAVDVVPGGDFSEASGRAAATVLLARAAHPDAVACANDQMAIGAMREFQRAGVRVPGDVAVTGFDDIFPGRFVEPALTTVGQPSRDLAALAATRLLERIDGRAGPPRAELLPTELVVRRSCGCPDGGRP